MPDQFSQLLSLPNVTGYRMGTKTVRGVDTGIPCLIVHVSAKVHPSSLAAGDLVPTTLEDGTITDVVQLSQSHAFSVPEDHRRRHKPLVGGISIGWRYWPGTGTLGGVFLDRDGDWVLHGDNHVIAMSFQFDPWRGKKGDAIRQPGVKDAPVDEHSNILSDKIAELKDWSEIDPQGVNQLDAATARLTEEALPILLGLGPYTGWDDTPEVGKEYPFSGRTSGVGRLKLLGTGVTMKIWGYGNMQGTVFEGLYLFGPGLQPGDSGSLIGCPSILANGFAGGQDHSLGIPMSLSRERFGLKIPPLDGVAVEEALASILDKVKGVWGWEDAMKSWVGFVPGQPAASQLKLLRRGNGYWVTVKEEAELAYGDRKRKISPPGSLIGWL